MSAFKFPDHLLPYSGALLGAAAGLVVAGFWGVVVGGTSGLAFDRWREFNTRLKNRIDPMPAMPGGLSPETTLALSVVAAARVYDLPGLRDDRSALQVLKAHFELDGEALRYIGKILRAPAALTDAHVPLQQVRQICGKHQSRARLVVICLLDLAGEQGGGMDRVSLDAIREAATTLGIAEAEWRELISARPLQTATDDAHDVLGLHIHAGADEITRVYRNLIREAHPDRWAGLANPYARARLQQRAARLNAAYEKLTKSRA